METTTYKIETELEFNRFIYYLEKSKIPHSIKINKDSSFPALGNNDIFAEISIPKDYETEVQSILNLISSNRIFTSDVGQTKPSRNYNPWIVCLIVYCIIVTIYALKFWYSNSKSSGDKNFNYVWNFDNTELLLVDKRSGKVIQQNIDKNYDLNFEKSLSFSRNGVMVGQLIDLDEDGFAEEIQYYDTEGKISGRNIDQDNDGKYDYLELVLENGDTLKLFDENRNGKFETYYLK